MAIEIVGSSAASTPMSGSGGVSGNTMEFSIPSGTQPGDLLVAFIGETYYGGTTITKSGWTAEYFQFLGAMNSTGGPEGYFFQHTHSQGDPDPVIFTSEASGKGRGGIMIALRGMKTADCPYDTTRNFSSAYMSGSPGLGAPNGSVAITAIVAKTTSVTENYAAVGPLVMIDQHVSSGTITSDGCATAVASFDMGTSGEMADNTYKITHPEINPTTGAGAPHLSMTYIAVPAADGPWRVVASGDGDPPGPGGANVMQSMDPGSSDSFVVDEEYEVESGTIIPIDGVSDSDIDSGGIVMAFHIQATRMTGETADEFKLALDYYDIDDTYMSRSQSGYIGTGQGLATASWKGFVERLSVPINARGFSLAIVAVKRATPGQAKLQFALSRTGVIRAADAPFADTHATILRAVAEDYWGLLPNVDNNSFFQFAINNTGRAGYYNPDPTITKFDWAREMLSDLLALPVFTTSGSFAVAQIESGIYAHDILYKHIVAKPVSVRTPNQHKTRTLGYARNYTIQNADTLAGAVDKDTAAFVALDYRTDRRSADDPPVSIDMSKALGAIESRSDTLLVDINGTDLELIRQLNMLAPDKSAWQFAIRGFQLRMKICDVVRITYPRWRFSSGRVGVILTLLEESKEQRTTITWWG